jgi:hypothetical protein
VTNIKVSIGDIDVDCKNRNDILQYIDHVPAKKTDGTKHATGVYVQDIEIDPLTGLAEVFYDESDYTKIDFLNLSTLNYFSSNEEISELISKEPNWDLLKIPEVVSKLPQIHDHFDLVQTLNPKSAEDLINVLHKIREHSNYKFKVSHATAYALNIIAILNYFEKTNTIPEST